MAQLLHYNVKQITKCHELVFFCHVYQSLGLMAINKDDNNSRPMQDLKTEPDTVTSPRMMTIIIKKT